MRDRKKQRELRRQRKREEGIGRENFYGNKDLTAYNAVQRIRTNGRSTLVLR